MELIARDYTWDIKTGKESKLSHFRLKDNYTRFYLKYISRRSVLIHVNGVREEVRDDQFLSKIIDFKDILINGGG